MSNYIMFRITAWVLFILFIVAAVSLDAFGSPSVVTITGKENLIVLDGPVIEPVVKLVSERLLRAPANPILWLNSPGGSVLDGMHLIDIIQSRGDVTCMTPFAASMGFAILQACQTRIVVGSVPFLLQHPTQLMLSGQTDTFQLKKQLREIVSPLEKILVKLQAKRIGMSEADFQAKQDAVWVLVGQEDILKANVADKAVFVQCTPEAVNKTRTGVVIEENLFGSSVKPAQFSYCPLVSTIISAESTQQLKK